MGTNSVDHRTQIVIHAIKWSMFVEFIRDSPCLALRTKAEMRWCTGMSFNEGRKG